MELTKNKTQAYKFAGMPMNAGRSIVGKSAQASKACIDNDASWNRVCRNSSTLHHNFMKNIHSMLQRIGSGYMLVPFASEFEELKLKSISLPGVRSNSVVLWCPRRPRSIMAPTTVRQTQYSKSGCWLRSSIRPGIGKWQPVRVD